MRARKPKTVRGTRDKLDLLMGLQSDFMTMVKVHPDTMSSSDKERHTKEVVLAMQSELSEILGEINWKPWKKARKKVDQHKLKMEIVDLFHFAFETAIIWGMTPQDLADYYVAKNKTNVMRQDNGY